MKQMLLGSVALIVSMPALADETLIPLKSNYSLFNPTPLDQLRSFSPDRPTKSNSPYTVDAGHFQYEADFLNWTYDTSVVSRIINSSFQIFDPTIKIGLSNKTDFEMAFAPINFTYSHLSGTKEKKTANGFGDLVARLKYNIFGNDSGESALAITPYFKAPTASPALGNNRWEGGVYVPLAIGLPLSWTLNLMSEADILHNAAMNGYHSNFSNLINVSHAIFDNDVTAYVEFWSDVNNDVGLRPQYTTDFSLSWNVKDNMQVDTGINVGLNQAANDVQIYCGIAQRF